MLMCYDWNPRCGWERGRHLRLYDHKVQTFLAGCNNVQIQSDGQYLDRPRQTLISCRVLNGMQLVLILQISRQIALLVINLCANFMQSNSSNIYTGLSSSVEQFDKKNAVLGCQAALINGAWGVRLEEWRWSSPLSADPPSQGTMQCRLWRSPRNHPPALKSSQIRHQYYCSTWTEMCHRTRIICLHNVKNQSQNSSMSKNGSSPYIFFCLLQECQWKNLRRQTIFYPLNKTERIVKVKILSLSLPIV